MRNKFNPDNARFYHLNNEGTRGVRIDVNGNRERLPVSFDGINVKDVAVVYWEQFGNFSFPTVRKGKKLVTVYSDSDVEATMWMPYGVKYPADI